jgi:pimeloyl-ACP methyl ester carboxylesterase
VTDLPPARQHAERRPDGVEVHWEERGEGPLVILAHHALWSYPGLYADLITDLARDHRVVVYDPRGCGGSTRRGPYDAATDAADLLAVVEAAGGGALVVAVGDGFNRVARVAAARPDLVSFVIALAPAAAALLPRSELKGSEVMAASDSVIQMLLQMLATDPRAALRTLIANINPDLDEGRLRERVEKVAAYGAYEPASGRARAWLEDDVSAETLRLGDRLVILHGGVDPMFEGVMRARVAELFPAATIEQIDDGPVSRPDITAARVRGVTRPTE